MTTVNIYLTFNGNCEEAFTFYKSVFGREFEYIGRYGEMHLQQEIPAVPENAKNKIMHITLPISKETMLMGNDDLDGLGTPVNYDSFTILIHTDNKEEADALFAKLARGGKPTMFMKETFWGSYYGMITDKFGIHWKINASLAERK